MSAYVPDSTRDPAAEQRNIQIAGMVRGDEKSALLRNLAHRSISKTYPTDHTREDPQAAIEYGDHNFAVITAIMCSTTVSTGILEVSICSASGAGIKGATVRVRSRSSRPVKSRLVWSN